MALSATHHPPSPALRERHADAVRRLKQKRQEIAELKAEVAELQWEIDQYRYPVLTLAKEIVSLIFLHLLPSHPRRAPLLGKHSPIILGQICRQWREIALDTSALWSSFSIAHSNRRKLKIIRLFLERSARAPLSIALICERGDPQGDVYSVMELLASHAARWQHISLCIHPIPYLNAVEGAMPLLRTLTIVSRTDKGAILRLPDIPKWTPTDSFRNAPLLRVVRLSFEIDSYSDSMPWHQLTAMNLECIDFKQFVHVLQNGVQLVHCRATIAPGKITPNDEYAFKRLPIIHIPHLQTLLLIPWRYQHADGIPFDFTSGSLDYVKLRFPALRILELPENMLGKEAIQTLAALIARSGCLLQELCIRDGGRTLMEPYEDAFPGIGKIFFGHMDMSGRSAFGEYMDGAEWEDGTESYESGSDDGM
ncbi:hypothetical protein C8F01DRAFT_1179600 [Mycena amicta]|nr:hypothetical protein C8F01DRAFT_1179600 [Mycena amicta]